MGDFLEHHISGCPRCDAEAHDAAVEEQQQEEPYSVGLVAAAAFAVLAVLVGWAGLMALLSRLL